MDLARNNDSSQLELLTFYLESDNSVNRPLYGINVFKVKELITLPRLTQKPNAHEFDAGVANVRGAAVPVVDLPKYYNCAQEASTENILIITEFCGSTQGFVVREVNKIFQLEWENITPPPKLVDNISGVNNGITLTGISILPEGDLLMIIDLEKIILDVLGHGIDPVDQTELISNTSDLKVFFVDDSLVARTQIGKILDKMNIKYDSAKDGQEALEMLDKMAMAALAEGNSLADSLTAIITDIEMPLMDGYMLTRQIKADNRFNAIPVVMHSSLSAEQSIKMGEAAGVDAYLTKLQPREFSELLVHLSEVN